MIHYEETMIMVEEFKKAKFNEEQTKVILKAVESARKDGLENLATKSDIHALELKIADVKSELKNDIVAVKLEISELRGDIKEINATLSTSKWFFAGIIIPLVLVALKLFVPTLFGN